MLVSIIAGIVYTIAAGAVICLFLILKLGHLGQMEIQRSLEFAAKERQASEQLASA